MSKVHELNPEEQSMSAHHKMHLVIFGSVVVNIVSWHIGLILGLQFGMPVDEYAAVLCRITQVFVYALLVVSIIMFLTDLLKGNAMLSGITMVLAMFGALAVYFQHDYLTLMRELVG